MLPAPNLRMWMHKKSKKQNIFQYLSNVHNQLGFFHYIDTGANVKFCFVMCICELTMRGGVCKSCGTGLS